MAFTCTTANALSAFYIPVCAAIVCVCSELVTSKWGLGLLAAAGHEIRNVVLGLREGLHESGQTQ